MTRNLVWRCAGLAALGVAGLSTLAHRAVFEAHRAGPASALEALFGLLTFVFAAAGILLLIHGRRLLHDPAREWGSFSAFRTPLTRDRHAVADLLARQAIARARQMRRRSR